VVTGKIYLDFEYRWDDELNKKNDVKVGASYKLPLSFINDMPILYQ
jgi:hypothetical protein